LSTFRIGIHVADKLQSGSVSGGRKVCRGVDEWKKHVVLIKSRSFHDILLYYMDCTVHRNKKIAAKQI
jgi:hypothetical protein